MQAWLTVEKHCVAIADMPLNHVTYGQLISDLAPIRVLERNLDGAIACHTLLDLDKISTRMDIRAVSDKLSQLFDVVSVDSLREGQHFRHQLRDDHFVDGAVGIG